MLLLKRLDVKSQVNCLYCYTYHIMLSGFKMKLFFMDAKFKSCIHVMENLVKGVSHRTFHVARLSFQYSLLQNMVRVCLHDKIWK